MFFLAHSTATIISFACLTTMTASMSWSALYTLNAELYPTHIRSTGVGFGNSSVRFAGVISPLLTGVIMQGEGGRVINLLMIAAMYLGVSFIALMFKTEQREEHKILDEED